MSVLAGMISVEDQETFFWNLYLQAGQGGGIVSRPLQRSAYADQLQH